MKNTNTFALLPTERERRTVAQEIEWLRDNFRMEKPLIVETIIIALKQRIKRVQPEEREHWKQVIKELESL